MERVKRCAWEESRVGVVSAAAENWTGCVGAVLCR